MRTFLLALALGGCAASTAPVESPPLQAALDADLRADWDALLAARHAVEKIDADGPGRAVILYHLGYIDWRLSSLAYMVTGQAGQMALTVRAVDELRRSVELAPASAEAQALLALCAAILVGLDHARADEMLPVVRSAWTVALADASRSPRVELLRAMSEFWMPPQMGGGRDKGVARWKSAIALFERAQPGAGALAPIWGHAEAWAWLGGVYMMMGKNAEATDALQRALALRPDFWWAKIALAQAKLPAP